MYIEVRMLFCQYLIYKKYRITQILALASSDIEWLAIVSMRRIFLGVGVAVQACQQVIDAKVREECGQKAKDGDDGRASALPAHHDPGV